ncbi:LysR family transcriptional regulator [Pseudooceanicola sp. CBS1P-1]|uniref:LysR family transcriptional regulator n=1 Tax=Pseudooceanicola albus TaxID=2692189 RepID=A0A6L7G2D5_9RHOB|nr:MULTISPECIES: LysR family transcriptional regulator [Pseudooceanicola]MBT9383736.1 LysR family transcriptional regulator [Pseudooceanicola endophyticus]MXN17590.1 LysR family transcriptional regulator [Pseudooceanicola albus]
MDLRKLHVFVTAAETLNYRHAAERLSVSPPAVSQQIHALEAELGLTLFRRRARGVELTEAGQLVLPALSAVVERVAQAEQEIETVRRGERGVIVMGYSTSLMSEDLLPDRLRIFCEANPEIEIDFRPLRVADAVAQMAEGELDVAVMRMPLPAVAGSIRVQTFTRSPMALAVPEGHRLAGETRVPVAALEGLDVVVMGDPQGVGLGQVVRALLERHGVRPASQRPIEDMSSMLGMVAAGMGVAVVPESIARARRRVRTIPFSDISPWCEAAVLSRGSGAAAHIRRLVEALTR